MKRTPHTQQTTRPKYNQIPHSSSSSRKGNFWAAPSSSLNLFVNNALQKPTSSIFLTSKPISTPRTLLTQTPYLDPLLRKCSEPLLQQTKSNLGDYSTDYGTFLSKEIPLSVRDNSSRLYHKLPKTDYIDKILTKKLLLEQTPTKPQRKTTLNSLDSIDAYGIRPKTQAFAVRPQTKSITGKGGKSFIIPIKTKEKDSFEGIKEIIKPKFDIKIEDSANEKKPLKTTDLFQKANLVKKFKIRTYLTQREEMKLKTPGFSDREISKRLLTPNLPVQAKKRVLLVIENLYLSDCRTKNNLKYCYLSLPIPTTTPVMPVNVIEAEFKEVLLVLKEKFNINSKELYLFLKTGKEIKSHYEIPIPEKTLILSTTRAFQGINTLLHKNHSQGFSLMKILYRLEKPLLNQEPIESLPISMDTHIQEYYGDVVDEVIKVLGGGLEGSEALEKKNRCFKKGGLEEFQVKKNARKGSLSRGERLVFKDKEEYLEEGKIGSPMIYSRRYEDICKICELYEKGNEEIIFNKTERDDDEEEGMVKELEQVRNLDEKGRLFYEKSVF